MKSYESYIRVMLEFRAMDHPIEITVPASALTYLDAHSDRKMHKNGLIVYRKPRRSNISIDHSNPTIDALRMPA